MRIKDNSNDKKYFTIVPNYILNHSSATDQALYLQMKRLVGDGEGICFASEKYFKDKLKIGSKALKTSLNYLLEHGWIKEEGFKEVDTAGGAQSIKTYLVKDIWKLNIEHYKGVSESVSLDTKGVSERNQRGVQKEVKGVRFQATKKNNTEEEQREEEHASALKSADTLNGLIELFKPVNPTYERIFKITAQRAALQRLVDKFGFEKMARTVEALPAIINQKYAPRITTPVQLEARLGDLIAFTKQERSGKNYAIL